MARAAGVAGGKRDKPSQTRVMFPVRLPKGLRTGLRRKAGHRNMNAVVVELIRRYVVGEIEL